MAYVPRELSARDTEIEVVIRGKAVKAKVVKKPFYIPAYAGNLDQATCTQAWVITT